MSVFTAFSGPVVCFGELLLRMAAPRGELLLQRPRLNVDVAGAEANVAVSLAHLGHAASMVSTVPDNALGLHSRNVLRGHGVDISAVNTGAGRMGSYFLTPGAGGRASEIIYDRLGSAFAQRTADSYDWDSLLAGAGWLHVSGVTAAIGVEAGKAVLAAVEAARRQHIQVSFDGNYRTSMWTARGESGAGILSAILAQADLAFIDQRDIALVLDSPSLAVGERAIAVEAAFEAYPTLHLLASTRRIQHSVDSHELSALLNTRDAEFQSQSRTVTGIVDRIGTGDAFAAGLLHGLLQQWDKMDCVQFALAAACSKHSVAGDIHPLSEAQILATMEGSLDVRR
jgi:2-dehydro-3-deoxygluconokinase